MPTPYFYAYPTIGGVMMGSRAIESFEYADLTRAADMRGEDVLIERQPGRRPGGRLADDSRRIVEVRLNGDWTQENAAVVGYAARVSAYYDYLEILKELAAVGAEQPVLLTVGDRAWEGSCTVERMSKPQDLNPWTYELALDLTLHGGALTEVTGTP
jgi:hypothetical protein